MITKVWSKNIYDYDVNEIFIVKVWQIYRRSYVINGIVTAQDRSWMESVFSRNWIKS